MNNTELISHLVLSFAPLGAISILCGIAAMLAVERFGGKVLWSVWLPAATAMLYLYYWLTDHIGTGEFAPMNLKSDGLLLPPMAVAIVAHVLHRYHVRWIIELYCSCASFLLVAFLISYYPTF